ncbi:lysoplasmalogenase [Agreia bicolorata]|uniref:lysoplasmalogenase n=1 Tax=Agreia bicolorata TaxID=110935 RepID=UPI000697F519|nr:lysoplasmalogenase [Agreia bicolorata]
MIDGRARVSTSRHRWAVVLFLILSAAHLVALAAGLPELAGWTKPLLMPALMLVALVVSARRGGAGIVLIVAALAFSWLGDVLLSSPGDVGFLLGLAAFFLAHLVYLVAFASSFRRRPVPLAAYLYVLWWIAFVLLLQPSLGTLLVPVAAYGLVLGASGAAALATNRLTAIGALLFVCSDSLLACRIFLPDFELVQQDLIIMALYLAGQGLIAWGAVRAARSMNEKSPEQSRD